MKTAYVFGGLLSETKQREEQLKLRPQAEYSYFLQRYPADLLDFQWAAITQSRLAKSLAKRGKPYYALALASLTLSREVDAYLATGEDIGLPLCLFAALYRVRTPVYIITHGSYLASRKFKALVRFLRRFPSVHFLTLSETIRSALVNEYGVPSRQAHNTSYGIDTEYFRPPQLPPSPFQICSAGAANRDYPTLIAACKGLPVELKIAAGSDWFPIQLDIESAALPAFVEARPYPYPELRDLFARSLFVVVPLHPGRHACGYATILNAMAMGKAVVATKTEHYSDFIIDGETGLYVEPENVEDLHEKLSWLLENPQKAAEMGRCARQRAEQFFSLDAYCKRIAAVMGLEN